MAKVAAAERFAGAIVAAFEMCEEGGVPLTQIQKIAVIEAAFLEFDGFEANLRSLATVGGVLRGLCGDGERYEERL